jgi:hypothetical protein
MSDKLSIQNEMLQFDLKNREFYDELTDEERKKFSNYLMLRWGSAVQGSNEMQEFYLIATNERLNRHFFAINQHPKLQWLSATTVSPGMGSQRHQWIAPKKKEGSAGTGSKKKQILNLFPNMKLGDVDVLSELITQKELDAYQRELGNEK